MAQSQQWTVFLFYLIVAPRPSLATLNTRSHLLKNKDKIRQRRASKLSHNWIMLHSNYSKNVTSQALFVNRFLKYS